MKKMKSHTATEKPLYDISGNIELDSRHWRVRHEYIITRAYS